MKQNSKIQIATQIQLQVCDNAVTLCWIAEIKIHQINCVFINQSKSIKL